MPGLIHFEADDTHQTPLNRSDTVLLVAEKGIEIVDMVLNDIDRDISSLLFLIDDNSATNTHIANTLLIPFINSASHRFALEVRNYSNDADEILLKPKTCKERKPYGRNHIQC
ncbi:hypothetical protein GEMRC1_000270 [Eukaryota sp. GEM-RC1]